MIIQEIVIGKPTGLENTYEITPGFIEPAPHMGKPTGKTLCEDDEVFEALGKLMGKEGSTVFAIHGATDGPVIYVANPRKVICGSCRTNDAKMKFKETDRDYGLRTATLTCPKCNGVYSALEVRRYEVKEKIYENL